MSTGGQLLCTWLTQSRAVSASMLPNEEKRPRPVYSEGGRRWCVWGECLDSVQGACAPSAAGGMQSRPDATGASGRALTPTAPPPDLYGHPGRAADCLWGEAWPSSRQTTCPCTPRGPTWRWRSCAHLNLGSKSVPAVAAASSSVDSTCTSEAKPTSRLACGRGERASRLHAVTTRDHSGGGSGSTSACTQRTPPVRR